MIDKNFDAPLAERMRPTSLENFYGQKHIVAENLLLSRAIKTGTLGSCIFYGPPGTGKTTLANIVASSLRGELKKLSAVSSGVSDAKKIIEQAKMDKAIYGKQTYLLLDECHRWTKAQSDQLLGAIEDGTIIFIGSTTENPYTSLTRAIVSRCRIFEFKTLDSDDVKKAILRAKNDNINGFGDLNVVLCDEALNHFAWCSAGDVRSALNSFELAVKTTPLNEKNEIVIDIAVAEGSTQSKAMSINEDMYYDLLSAFCKSIRGSDSDAALYYSQRLIKSGCDPKIIARRLIAHCSEDIGMADSNAMLLAS
ncbi:MAG: AAA family ATPase, partial [Clostridia bacterium]